jgi:hypothetical protein
MSLPTCLRCTNASNHTHHAITFIDRRTALRADPHQISESRQSYVDAPLARLQSRVVDPFKFRPNFSHLYPSPESLATLVYGF